MRLVQDVSMRLRAGIARLGGVLVFVSIWGLAIVPVEAIAARPSAETVEALKLLSGTKPCAAAALLFLVLQTDGAPSGVFYLPHVPTPTEIARLTELSDIGAEDFPPQPNLYGEVNFYTAVSWSVEKLNDRVIVVSTQAQLVDGAGVKVTPAHVIESETRVLVVGRTLRVLPTASVE
jgi:hypothetical protein